MSDNKPFIFVFSDSPTANTGFGTVNKEVFSRLKDKYNLIFLGINFTGDPIPGYKEFNIHPCNGDPRGRDKFQTLLEGYAPDLLFTLNDYDALTWAIPQLMQARDKLKKNIPWVFQFPVDGYPFYQRYTDMIRQHVDVPITLTKFGQDTIKQTDPDLHVDYIYHGVDKSVFRKIDENAILNPYTKATIKSEKERLKVDDKFIVLMVGVNQIRKQYNIAIEAFAEFAKDKPDAVLHLHTAKHTSFGWDLPTLINRESEQNVAKGGLPIDQRIVFTNGIVGPLGISRDDMIMLYNFADVFLSTSCSEGFGIPLIEAMACETPVITHSATAMGEVVGDAAMLVDTAYHYTFPFGDRSLSRPIPDKSQIVDSLNELYENKNKREELAKKGRERVVSEVKFDWDYIANQVSQKIEEGLEDKHVLSLEDQVIL